jgi:hypothetical protein
MTAIPDRAEQQAEVQAEKTRAYLLPIAAAVILFAVIAYIQFTGVLGKAEFPVKFVLAIGFYYCYRWHTALAQRANVHAEKLKKG